MVKDPSPLPPTPFDLGATNNIGIFLSLCSIILARYSALSLTGFPSACGRQNMVKAPPAPPLFDLGTPKTIGILLSQCSIILVSYNVLSLIIFP